MSIFKIVISILTVMVLFMCIGVTSVASYYAKYDLALVTWLMSIMFAFFSYHDYVEFFTKDDK